jgi:hypothetical protein
MPSYRLAWTMPAALRGPLLATIEIQVTPAAQRFFNERLTYQD